VVEAVRPSVVYITSEEPATVQASSGLPPGFEQLIPPQLRPQQRSPHGQQQPEAIEQSSGSGFIVSTDGYILTNNHVVNGATKITVSLIDGRRFPARIVGTDKDTDIGVLKIDATGLTPAALGSSDNVRVGEWVLAIGNPLGDALTFSVTQGIVSAKGRGSLNLPTEGGQTGRQIQDFIQTDAAINRGNSGGPLVNVRGEVVGINSAIASPTGFYQGYAFAVPIDLARKVMDQIIAHGRVERTGLGVFVRNADADDAAYLGLPAISGVKIDDFAPDGQSPAHRAGLEPGDVIVAIDGAPIKYVAQLQQVVGFRRPGETVHVEVMRKDGRHEYTVQLAGVAGGTDSSEAPQVEKENGNPATGVALKLGLTVEPLTSQLANEIGANAGMHGLVVQSVAHNSPSDGKFCPLEAQGACTPDVITEVEGKPVRSEQDLRSALSSGKNGVVSLTVVRPGAQLQSRIERVRLANK
jgi:serine protease Do